MARKEYCIINDDKQTVTFVADKISTKEAAVVKGLIAIGYAAIRVEAEELYPSEETYKKEKVLAFLEKKGEEAKAKFEAIMQEPAKDKDGRIKVCKNGKPRKKGYVGALRWFKDEYKEEYLAAQK